MNASHPRAVEYLLAWLMVGWGSALLLPGPILVGDVYRYLLVLAPEPVIGLFSITVGLIRIAALVINGAWRRGPLVRLAGAALGLIWWVVLGQFYGLAVIQGAPPFPMLAFFPVFIFFEGYSGYRCGQDAFRQKSLTVAGGNERSRLSLVA